MGGVASLAKASGYRVTGCDTNVYPPMSTQLQSVGIELIEGFDKKQTELKPDLYVIGNVVSRGNPLMEEIMNRGLPYISGPQWLYEAILKDKWVLAVAGTHGKTTTSSMLAWILEFNGYAPGFLIGGVPLNFDVSARLPQKNDSNETSPFFVIEADEYDTAFFDKRSKFVHYRPRTLVINNLEYDHADIFPDLAAIQRQFHHLLRMVPANGLVLSPEDTPAVCQTLQMGCWSERQSYGKDWRAELLSADGSHFALYLQDKKLGELNWQLSGQHNVDNAVMAIAAARHAGVPVGIALDALAQFIAPKRRMELKADVAGIKVYDDFAHHPTAISTTLQGMRNKVGQNRVLAVLEPRSNTMRMGVHQAALPLSLALADKVFLYEPANANWSLDALSRALAPKASLSQDIDALVSLLTEQAEPGDSIVIMSNGGFGGIHDKLISALKRKREH
mgnify:CR=1 FL=1